MYTLSCKVRALEPSNLILLLHGQVCFLKKRQVMGWLRAWSTLYCVRDYTSIGNMLGFWRHSWALKAVLCPGTLIEYLVMCGWKAFANQVGLIKSQKDLQVLAIIPLFKKISLTQVLRQEVLRKIWTLIHVSNTDYNFMLAQKLIKFSCLVQHSCKHLGACNSLKIICTQAWARHSPIKWSCYSAIETLVVMWKLVWINLCKITHNN